MTQGPVIGIVHLDPGYALPVTVAEIYRHRLAPLLDSRKSVLLRDQPSAQAAIELMLARIGSAIEDRTLPSSYSASFVAGYITALQERRLGDYAFDILVELAEFRYSKNRPMTKRQHAAARPEARARRRRPRRSPIDKEPTR